MNHNKNQRKAQIRANERAIVLALRVHFSGAGATKRSVVFVKDVLIASLIWFSRFVFVASWAVVAHLLVGPDHADYLTKFHAWMVQTPVDEVVDLSRSAVLSVAWYLGKMSLLAGVCTTLFKLVKPAVDMAKMRFQPETA